MSSGFIERYKKYACAGNGVLLFITNEEDEAASALFMSALLPSLNHFGMPYRMIDVSLHSLESELNGCAAIVLAHDGVAAALATGQWEKIVAEVEAGAGLVSFDGELHRARVEIRQYLGCAHPEAASMDELQIVQPDHYITRLQGGPRRYTLRAPVAASLATTVVNGFTPLAADGQGRVIAVAGDRTDGRAGKRAALYCSPQLWMKQHFGHAMGLDDLLWRSLVWAARKPFATLMIPPFAVCRVDDCIGSYDRFDYIRVLNEYGWIPNIGLFVDDVGELEAAAIWHYHDRGLAQFSAHSFHELGDPLPDQIYLQHDGTEYSFQQLEEHFRRLDAYFERLGVTPSQTVNIHYDELGLYSLPFLLRRNQTFMMALIPFGVNWNARSYAWDPFPYGHQGFHYGPMEPDGRFWNVMAHHLGAYKTPDAGMGPGEFLGNCTVFGGESARNDVEQAVDRAVEAIRVGISSGFFATLMTHEQRVAVLSPEEWRAIIAGIDERIGHLSPVYRSYDEIAMYCKDKARTRISSVVRDGELRVQLEGTADHGQELSVYLERDDHGEIACERVATGKWNGSRWLAVDAAGRLLP